MGRVILVTGGAKSGKSMFAERLVAGLGDHVVYVATGEAYDDEMQSRIALHRTRRPADWTTIEAPYDLRAALEDVSPSAEVVLLDCLTLWTSNHLLALGDPDDPAWWNSVEVLQGRLLDMLEGALAAAHAARWHLVLVTNEVGSGIVPATPLGRAFRDLLGAVTQQASAVSDSVFLVVAGLGVEVKALALEPEDIARSLRGSSDYR